MNKPIHAAEWKAGADGDRSAPARQGDGFSRAPAFQFDPSLGPFDYGDGDGIARIILIVLGAEAFVAFGIFIGVALNGHAILGALQ